MYYYNGITLEALREGNWKLHLPRIPESKVFWSRSSLGGYQKLDKPVLFDLGDDIGEQTDLADKYPEVVQRLLSHAQKARKELGDWNINGKGQKRLLNYTGNINNPTRVMGVNPHLKE